MSAIWRDLTRDSFVTESEIRALHPRTVFPTPFTPQPELFAPVIDEPAPPFDPLTHELVRGEPVQDVDGAWHRSATVQALPPEVAEANQAAARKASVPASVTRRQARQALLLAGLLDDVPAALAAIPDPIQRALAQIEWEDSQVFERQRPLLVSLASALGLDEDALDDLFLQAAQL
jgi:hypothetical protein